MATVALRYITPTEAAMDGWLHATANYDLLVTGNDGDILFHRFDDNATPVLDPNTSAEVEIKANQKIFLEGGVGFAGVGINFWGVDTLLLAGATTPLLITNIGGQFKSTSLSLNGLKNAKLTGKYMPGVSGNLYYQGSDFPGIFEGVSGSYGIEIHQSDENAPAIGLTKEQYGSMEYSSSNIEVEFVEGSGGFAFFSLKGDWISDSGYYTTDDTQCYEDREVPTDWTSSTSFTTGQRIKDTGVGKTRYYADKDFISLGTIALDIEEGDRLIEMTKRDGTMWGMDLHDNYIHDVGREGVYAGHTSGTGDAHHSIQLRLYNNRFIRGGGEAIQCGRLIPDLVKYAINSDDSVSEWKSIIRNNIVEGGAMQWLRDGSHGFYNFQDKGMQMGCRNGGIEMDHNIIGPGGSDGLFMQMDGSGGSRVSDPTRFGWIGTQLDKDTHVWIHHNYFIGSRDRLMYLQAGDMSGVTNSYITIEDNYIAEHPFTLDILDSGFTATAGLITGNNDISYIDFVNNTKKGARPLLTAFGPPSSRITESGTTTDSGMDLIEMVNSGWDDANEEYKNMDWWVKFTAAGNGDPDLSSTLRYYLVGDIVVKDNTASEKDYAYECTLEHDASDTLEPNVGATWTTAWVQIPRLRADDWRLVQGSTYHTLGVGLSSNYDTQFSENRDYNQQAKDTYTII